MSMKHLKKFNEEIFGLSPYPANRTKSNRPDESEQKDLNIKQKLNDIFFGKDETNLFSNPNEFGYLSQEHRLSKG